MQIHCPSCATSYMIEPPSLGAAGRTARRSRCGTTWFCARPAAAVAPPAAVAEAIADPAGAQAAATAAPAPSHATGDFGPEPEAPVGDVPQADTAAIAETAPTIVVEAPPLVPPAGHEPLPGDAAAAAEAADIESF